MQLPNELPTSLLVYELHGMNSNYQDLQIALSALCASEMVIILHIKPQEILEKTPLGYKFYDCVYTI